MKKKVFCLIAALFTFVTGIYAQAEESITNGTCGDCTWTFDADKNVMTISPVAGGTGRLADFPDIMEAVNQGGVDEETQAELFKRPWGDFSQDIKQLIIEDGVTYIGKWCFILIALEEVVIPQSVTEIGAGAFMCNFGLKKVVIGEGVETIGKMAFFMTRPEELIVGSNVKYVGEAALGVSERINVTCLGPAFEEWDEYTEDIDAKSTIYVLENKYEGWAEKYPKLIDNFRYNVEGTQWTSGDCHVQLNTDNTITVSGTGAMADYASTDDVPWKEFSTKVRRVTFENGVTKIGKNAFDGFTTALNVEVEGDQLATWEGAATDFSEGTTFHFNKDGQWLEKFPALLNRSYEIACGGSLYWNYDKTNKVLNFYKKVYEESGEMNNYGDTDETRPSWYPLREVVDTVKFAHGLKYIGAYAFNDFIHLKAADMPSTLTNCGEAAFQYTSIERFEFPSSMTTIPARIFNTAHLTDVIIPEGVTEIGEKAFQFCSHLEKLYLPRTLKTIGANAFNLVIDNIDVYVTAAKPSDITWTSESTDFGPNTRFHVLSGMTSVWNAAHPNALVQYVEMTYTEDNPYEVRTIDDWRHLRDMVNNGARPIYAKMMNDINMGNTSDFLGTQEHPFNGVFDGQGYTWNGDFDEAPHGHNYRAPFRYINGATIRNLRVTGRQRNYTAREGSPSGPGLSYTRINASNYCGGIVGMVSGTDNVIESCTMSGRFHYGNKYCGGIAGYVAPEGSLDIRNTLFDGKFEMGADYYHGWYAPQGYQYDGPKPVACSPFVGQNEGTLNVTDCYYAGFADTKWNKGCNVIVGETKSGAQTNVDNCYYILNGDELDAPEGTTEAKDMEVGQIERELGAMWQLDGETTVKPYLVVEDFEGEGTRAKPYLINSEHNWRQYIYHSRFYPNYSDKMWKQTADITTTKWGAKLLQNDNAPIYDGDNHTLNIDIETTRPFAAPFRLINNGTIKNLMVKGSVKGGLHTAALVSECTNYATVDNCAVEADVTFGGSTMNNAHGGGVIGHINSATARLYDCVYSGKLTATDNGLSDGTWAGALVGWGEQDADLRFENCYELCEFDENVKYADFYWLNNQSVSNQKPATGALLTKCYYAKCQTIGATKVTRIGDKEALKDVPSASHTCYILLGIDLYMVQEGTPSICYLTYGDNSYVTYGLLLNDADNKNLIETYKGGANDLTIYGRTLYKDGSWNTLCLPFSLSQEQLQADDCPLKGVSIKTLNACSFNEETGTLTLNFRDDNSIQANTPYIIKWNKPTDEDESATVVNPTFKGVSIEDPIMSGILPYVDAGDVQFIGRFAPKELKANDRTILYMGSNNKLYYPTADMKIGAFRCYFKLVFHTVDDLKAGSKSIVLDFGDGESTGIVEMGDGKLAEDNGTWYDLSGRKMANNKSVNGHFPKGIYINNGKKVIIK